MSTVSMSGNDSLTLMNRVLSDLADQNAVELTFPNDISALKTGKNGNTIYALNETGQQAEMKIRAMRGSADDKWLNGLLAQQRANFAGFPLMFGEFVKRIGDGTGVVTKDTYVLGGGIFSKNVEAKSNVEGDTEQSVSMYTIKFSNAPRAIGG